MARNQYCGITAQPTRTRSQHRANFNHRARAPLAGNVDMAYLCQVAMIPLLSWQACLLAVETNPIGDAAGNTETTVDQADIRALVSRKTVVRHGAASL